MLAMHYEIEVAHSNGFTRLGVSGELDLAAESALVRYVWKAGPVLTLAHDVSHGGVEQAVGEAAEWSGLEADVELPQGGRGGGQVLLACAPEDVERLGTKNVARIGAVR